MFASFTSKLPWEDCGQEFNSDHCFSITDYANCTEWRNETGGNYIYHRGKIPTTLIGIFFMAESSPAERELIKIVKLLHSYMICDNG